MIIGFCVIMCVTFLIVGVLVDFIWKRDVVLSYIAFVLYIVALIFCVLGILLSIALSLTKGIVG